MKRATYDLTDVKVTIFAKILARLSHHGVEELAERVVDHAGVIAEIQRTVPAIQDEELLVQFFEALRGIKPEFLPAVAAKRLDDTVEDNEVSGFLWGVEHFLVLLFDRELAEEDGVWVAAWFRYLVETRLENDHGVPLTDMAA